MTDLGLRYVLGGADAVTFLFTPDFVGAPNIPRTYEFIYIFLWLRKVDLNSYSVHVLYLHSNIIIKVFLQYMCNAFIHNSLVHTSAQCCLAVLSGNRNCQ